MRPIDDLTGVRIAEKYELVRLLGRGGMGAVYEARNLATLKRCAVKVLLSPELAGDAEVVRRFFREARASGLIENEHVVAAFDSGIDSADHVYYVMECLSGEDLEQKLRQVRPLAPQAAIKIAFQAATGLASAHALGIVHRDVKPANLFLAAGPDGVVKVKILDFGVAKVKMEVFNESAHSLTHSGSILGTPLYMSPEQLRRASAIDESADVWSLGVVLFECLTGESPWGQVAGIGELVAAILTAEVPHLQDLAPWVSPELAEVVHRMLSRDAGRRLASAAEVRDALRQLMTSPTLLQSELFAPADETRSQRAPRLSFSDTVMLRATPGSGTPVVSTIAPPRLGVRPLAIIVGMAAVAGSGAWTLARSSAKPVAPFAADPAHSVAAVAHDQHPPTAAAPATAPSATPAPKERLLPVGPAGVAVTVDGVATPVRDGKVAISGAVGTVRSIELKLAGRVAAERVAITAEGLLPSRLAIAPKPHGPAAERVRPAAKPDPSSELPPTLPVSGVPSSRVRLSDNFE